MLPNKSANSGAIKGSGGWRGVRFLPPCLLDEEEYEAGPIFRDNEIQALCLAPLPRWSSWKQGPGRPEAAWYLTAPLDSSPGFLDSEKVLSLPLK